MMHFFIALHRIIFYFKLLLRHQTTASEEGDSSYDLPSRTASLPNPFRSFLIQNELFLLSQEERCGIHTHNHFMPFLHKEKRHSVSVQNSFHSKSSRPIH